MSILIESSPLKELSPECYRLCRNLNRRHKGDMRRVLSVYRKQTQDEAWVLLAWENSTLVGWALVYRPRRPVWFAQFYVRRSHRRRGIGSRLLRHAARRFGTLRVWPWDSTSKTFFKRHEALVHTR